MSESFFLFMLALAVLVVIACIVTVLARRLPRPKEPTRLRPLPAGKQALPPGQVQPKEASTNAKVLALRLPAGRDESVDNENRDLLLIKYVPAEMSRLETGFTASAKAQAELLAAGDTVLRKLPTDIRNYLSCPVSYDLTVQLSQGDNPNDLIPERVRAAVGVAEASLALWALMFEFDYKVNQLVHQVVLDELSGVLTAGKQVFVVSYVIARIRYRTRVNLAVATAMWKSIVEILREGLVTVPGIRAMKSPV